jgi:WD40 repeat protein/serine/threonine protein kinase
VLRLTVQPKQIGPYVIVDTLGHGGMGVVYLAEQIAPIKRRVALKLIRADKESRQVIARFDAERQTLALMDHPNIASVYDAGSTDDGRPYFVMEFVPGVPITEFCDTHRLSTRSRLELFQQVCSAVQHAHQKGIIHRDLKPSNVLVTDQDGRALPKVIDFGVARATEQRLQERSMLTEHGVLIGTPEYMSPEQAGPHADDVDTRTDIYSLGVLLYELLVGGLPFPSVELRRAGLAEIHRIVRESEPSKPSTKLTNLGAMASGIAENRQTSISTLTRELRGDLDWITLKAIDKEPTRRYSSASEFSADISRHLAHEPVEAGPLSASYRVRKFVRKHRGAVAAAVALIAILVGGLTLSSLMYARAERSRREAVFQAYRSALLAANMSVQSGEYGQLRQQLEATDPLVRGWEWRYLNRSMTSSAGETSKFANDVLQVAFLGNSRTVVALGVGDATKAPVTQKVPDRQVSATRVAFGLTDVTTQLQLGTQPVAISPDGARVLSVDWAPSPYSVCSRSADGASIVCAVSSNGAEHRDRLTIRDTATGAIKATLFQPNIGIWRGTSPSRDTQWVTIGLSFRSDGQALPSLEERYRLVPQPLARMPLNLTQPIPNLSGQWPNVVSATFSGDGSKVATWSWDNAIYVWDIPNQRLLTKLQGHRDGITSACFDAAGDRLASSAFDGTVRVWDVNLGTQLASLPLPDSSVVTFSPIEPSLAVGTNGGSIAIIAVPGGRVIHLLSGHSSAVSALAFSPDGKRLMSAADNDRTAYLWDVVSGAQVLSFAGHSGGIKSVCFAPDGDAVATGSRDGTVRVWSTTNAVHVLSGHVASVTAVDFSTSGDHIVSLSSDGTAHTWDISKSLSTSERSDLGGHAAISGRVGFASFSPGGDGTRGARPQRTVRVVDLVTGNTMLTVQLDPALIEHQIAISQDGSRLAVMTVASDAGSLGVWDVSTGTEVARWSLQATFRSISRLSLSSDGKRIAVCLEEPSVLPNMKDSDRAVVFQEGTAAAIAVVALPFASCPPVFQEDGRRLLYVGPPDILRGISSVYLLDFRAGAPTLLFSADQERGPAGGRTKVAIGLDASRIVTGGADGNLRIWDAVHREVLLTIRTPAAITAIAVSPDGNRIAVGMNNGLIEVFSAPSVNSLGVNGPR